MQQEPEEVFKPLQAEESEPEVQHIESVCVNCRENGMTRLLLTKIPFYKEVVIMSFECEHCGFSNNELQPAATIAEKGIMLDLHVYRPQDINRQVIKTEYAKITIPQIEFEIPEKSQPGLVTTVEGIIDRAITGLRQTLMSETLDVDNIGKITKFVRTLEDLKKVEHEWNFILEDASGNSFIENPYAPEKDLQVVTTHFTRTPEQDHMLGLTTHSEPTVEEDMRQEVHSFPSHCPSCGAICDTKMKLTDIPHFKEVVIMATTCDECGYRSNEVKSGAGIEPKGRKLILHLNNVVEDLKRDVLKSETCYLNIPELDFELGQNILSGRFTTVEGLIDDIIQFLEGDNPFLRGDSADPEKQRKFEEFMGKLESIKKCQMPATLILDDPCGNSYIQNYMAPDPDPRLTIELYERTFEQSEELGLNDMKTENYGEQEILGKECDSEGPHKS